MTMYVLEFHQWDKNYDRNMSDVDDNDINTTHMHSESTFRK